MAGHYDGIDGSCASYSYHSVDDTVVKLPAKVEASEVLSRYRRHDLRIITEADVDGRIFKDTSYSMYASIRGLFDMTLERWRGDGGADDVAPETDFDL